MDAIWSFEGEGNKLDMNDNRELKKAAAKAIKNHVPNSHVKRFLDLAEQGWKSIHFDKMDTDWQGEGYGTVSGQTPTTPSVYQTHSWMPWKTMVLGTSIIELS